MERTSNPRKSEKLPKRTVDKDDASAAKRPDVTPAKVEDGRPKKRNFVEKGK